MCGILLTLQSDASDFTDRLKTLTVRGPDESHIVMGDDYIIGHNRLCITNPMEGKQPIVRGDWIVVHNGEIYNAPALTHAKSDSYFIMDQIEKAKDPKTVPILLDGIFAFCAYNTETGQFICARDPVGVIPLYWSLYEGRLWVASEMKALHGHAVQIVPPGYVLDENGNLECYKVEYPQVLPNKKHVHKTMVRLMSDAIVKRLHLDVPWAMLLSGGLDSAIIATLIDDNIEESNVKWKSMHTFSIGLKGSPDLYNAREMAHFLPCVEHHEVTFTVEEGIAALRDCIYAIESYDVTTVRASVPMYLLGKHIKKCGIKVVFSGEGSDELFGGYLYNRFCPSREEMHAECVTKMERLHYHDCLRANKSMACHGIECRVPFLDKAVVNYAMRTLDPSEKMTVPTKKLLRDDFKDFLPKTLATRVKEQFSDGVGDRWIEGLKEHAELTYTEDRDTWHKRFPFQTPQTREAFMYRSIFSELFGSCGEETVYYSDDTCACSSERGLRWSKNLKRDPSAKQIIDL